MKQRIVHAVLIALLVCAPLVAQAVPYYQQVEICSHATGVCGTVPISATSSIPVNVQNTPGVVVESAPPVSPATTFPVNCVAGCSTPAPQPTQPYQVTGVGGSPVPVSVPSAVSVQMPYTYTNGQTATANSFVGVGGYNSATGKFEPFRTVLTGLQATSMCDAFNFDGTDNYCASVSSSRINVCPATGANACASTNNYGDYPVSGFSGGFYNGVSFIMGHNVANSNFELVNSQNNSLQVIPGTVATPAAISTPASSASSVTLLAQSSTRNGFTICNSSTQILYVAKAATASTTSYTLPFPAAGTTPYCYSESGMGVYRGILTGIWASANGNAIVTAW